MPVVQIGERDFRATIPEAPPHARDERFGESLQLPFVRGKSAAPGRLARVGGKAEWSAAMLGNSSCPRPLAVLADLDRAAKAPRLSRFSRLARALRERPRIARVSGRPRRASNASGLGPPRACARGRGLTTKDYVNNLV